MVKRIVISVGSALLSLLLMTACKSSSTPSSGGAPAKAAATATPPPAPTKLNVSYSNLTTTVLPLWVAKDAGIFSENGLDVSLQFITGSASLPAVTSGSVEIAFMGGTEVLNGALGGADLVAFMNEAPGVVYYLSASSNINSVDDLKGKKIGVSSFGSTSDTTTRQVLHAKGIEPSQVTFVAVGSPPARAAALVSGAIQGALTTPPDSFTLAQKGVKNLFDVASLNLPPTVIAYAAKRSYIDQHKAIIQKFTDSIIQAEVKEKADKTFAVQEMEKYLKNNDTQVMDQTYDYFVTSNHITIPPDITTDQFGGTVDEVGIKNPKAKTFDVSTIVDDSYVKNAIQRGLAK